MSLSIPETIVSADIYIKETHTDKGRGVFAGKDYAAGDIVEICPVVILHRPFNELPSPLKTLVYDWGNLTTPNSEWGFGLVLGNGSMYNHSNPANLQYEAIIEGPFMRYIAATAIARDQELTINYNNKTGGVDSDNDSWFDRHEIKLL